MNITVLTDSDDVSGLKKWWHKLIFLLPITKNVGACGGVKLTFFAAKNESQDKKEKKERLLHKSIWVGATYLWHSGRHRKQHFKKWRSFSVKSSAHGQQSHKPTEGPESLSAPCAISIPGLSLNTLLRYFGEKKKLIKKGTRTTL